MKDPSSLVIWKIAVAAVINIVELNISHEELADNIYKVLILQRSIWPF